MRVPAEATTEPPARVEIHHGIPEQDGRCRQGYYMRIVVLGC